MAAMRRWTQPEYVPLWVMGSVSFLSITAYYISHQEEFEVRHPCCNSHMCPICTACTACIICKCASDTRSSMYVGAALPPLYKE